MESARTFLWLTFGALGMFLFIEWNEQSTRTTFAEVEQTETGTTKKEYNDIDGRTNRQKMSEQTDKKWANKQT